MKRRLKCVWAVVAMLDVVPVVSAFADYDLTAYMRSRGDGAYMVETYGGTAMYSDGFLPSNAVDGINGAGSRTQSGRVLFSKTIQGGANNPCDLRYSFLTHGGTNYAGKVSSFTVFRLNADAGNDFTRTPTRFSLYGSNDGNDWTLLCSNEEAIVWNEETASATFAVPQERRRYYSQYRFAADASTVGLAILGYHELVLTGEVAVSRVWTGADDSGWNVSDSGWTGNTGPAPLWGDAEIAVFGQVSGKTVVVGDGMPLGGMTVLAPGYVLSAGRLELMPSAQFDIDYPLTVSSDVSDASPVATSAHAEYLPYGADNTKGVWVKMWENASLDIMKIKGAWFNGGGYSSGNAVACSIVTNGSAPSVTVQFQHMPGPLLCVKVEFMQVGRDVWARALYAGYSWDSNRSVGVDFDTFSPYRSSSLATWNVKDIEIETGSGSPVVFNLPAQSVRDLREGVCLPQSVSDSNTGEAVMCWRGLSLSDLDGIESCTFYDGNTVRDASIHFFTNDGATATFQLQCNRPSDGQGWVPRLCVKVQMVQTDADIFARAVYAKYWWPAAAGVVPGVIDFDDASGAGSVAIRDASHSVGYGVADLCGRFRSSLRIDGRYRSSRDIHVREGVLSFGAGELDLTNAVSGTGTVRFSPMSGSAQSIVYHGTCTCSGGVAVAGASVFELGETAVMGVGTELALEDGATLVVSSGSAIAVGAVRFSGTTTVRIDSGASLSLSDASFADDSVVNLVLAEQENNKSLRVGLEATLTKAELSRLRIDGRPLKKQYQDGWVVTGAVGFAVIMR